MALNTHHTVRFKQTLGELPRLPLAAPPTTSGGAPMPSECSGPAHRLLAQRWLRALSAPGSLPAERGARLSEKSGLVLTALTPACPVHPGV